MKGFLAAVVVVATALTLVARVPQLTASAGSSGTRLAEAFDASPVGEVISRLGDLGLQEPPAVTGLAKADIPARYRKLYAKGAGECPRLSAGVGGVTVVGWQVLAGLGKVESDHGRAPGSKRSGSSSAGALGPMQFMPGTWPAYGHGSVYDPANAIPAAARYLCAHGGQDRLRAALWAYNVGPGGARHPSRQVREYAVDVLAWAWRYRTGRFS
jgi:hypothetical protein